MLQILLAILAGILTVGAPCILPILPILLGSTVGQTGKTRVLAIVSGFILTFAVVGVSLSLLINQLGLAPDTLRNVAVVMLAIFGTFLIWPTPFEHLTRRFGGLFNRMGAIGNRYGNSGNWGGFVLGVVLGIIWTPCAGPVLGSILTLVATSTDLARAGILLFAYAVGAGIPMLIIGYGSQYVTARVAKIARYSKILQQFFGILIVLLAVAMFFQYDLVLQAKLLEFFPSNYLKF